MKNIKQLLLFVTLLVLLIGIASASEVNADTTTSTNDVQTVADDSTAVSQDIVTQEKQIMKNDNTDTPVKKAASIEVTQENYDTYFQDGVYSDEASDILLSGEFNGKDFVFASPVSITSKDSNTKVYNSSFNFFTGADGSSLTNVYIEDKNYTNTVILINEVNNIKIQNNTIIQYNDEGETHAITLDLSDNNLISDNNITVSGTEYQVMYDDDYMPITSLSAIHAHQINYNKITNNNITTKATKYNGNEVATTVGFDFYSNPMSAWMGDDPDGSENNEISGNIITTEGIKYAYSIRLNNNMNNNTIKNNKITSTSFYAYGIEYAYGDYAKIIENNITCNGNLSYGIIYTTNSMGDINNGLIENNNILVNDANVAYLIEFYGGARSFDTIINNNTLTATGGQIIGIAGALSNRLNITNNKITITGNSTRTLNGLSEEILPELTGIKIAKSSDNLLVSENMLNITDLSDGDINSLNLMIKNSKVLDNQIHVSSYVNSRSFNITGTDNTVEGNYPFTQEPVILKMDSLATEKSLPTNVYLTATDTQSRTFTHGTVVFKLNNEEIGTSTITNGEAVITFTPELDVGTYTIEATYLADDWFMENSTTCTLEILDPYFGVYYVSPTGSDTNEGSQNSPKKTVKNAVEMASKEGKNKNIIILDGTYVESNIEINVPLNITGEGNVVIDANHEGLIFTISTDDTEIKNIKFINGINKNGGAINTTGKLTLENVTFESNNATSYGGAVYSEGDLVVSASKFINNTGATGGGAIYDVKGTVTITDSEFTGQYSGGGGAVYSKIMTTIDNSVFTDNRARAGGSLYISGNGTVTDTNFTASSSDNSGAVLYQSDIRSSVNLTNVNVKDCVSNTSLFHYNNEKSVLDKVNITDSTSTQYLIYLSRGNLTITDSNIKDNNCSKSLINSYDRTSARFAVLTVENSNITNNTALNIFDARGEIDLISNEVWDNTATSGAFFKVTGSGVYTAEGNTFLRNNIANLTVDYNQDDAINSVTIDVSAKASILDENNIPSGKIIFINGETQTEYSLDEGKVSIPFTSSSMINPVTVKYVDNRINSLEEETSLDIIILRTTDIIYNIINNTEGNVQINITVIDAENQEILPDSSIKVTGDITADTTSGILTDTTLTPGDYTINVQYLGNETHKSSQTTITFTVKKIPPKLIVDQITATAGDIINITARITEHDGTVANINKGKVTFKVNGKTLKDASGKVIYVKVVNGVATIENYEVPNEWTKEDTTIEAVYSGSTQCEKLSSEKTEITIEKAVPTLTTSNITATAGETITLTATITDNDKVINNGKVVFKINGKTVKDANGKVIYAKVVNNQVSVEYTLPADMKVNKYNLTAIFTSPDYERLEDTKTLTIE